MRVVKCIYNHFFDADKYTVCPQCGASMATGGEPEPVRSGRREQFESRGASPAPSKSGETFGVFKNKAASMLSRKPKQQAQMPARNTAANNYENLKRFNVNRQSIEDNSGKNVLNANSVLGDMSADNDIVDQNVKPEVVPEPVKAETVPVSASAPVAAPVITIPMIEEPEPVESNVEPVNEVDVASVTEKVSEPQPVVESVPEPQLMTSDNEPEPEPETTETQEPEPREDSLYNEVKKVAADNDGKTVGFFSASRSFNSDEESQNNSSSNVPEDEPVVGWLVCIEGPCIGQSFNIYAGKNSLGRSHSNKIVINKDRSISREKHAWIIYEPKHRDFFAQPGDSSGLTYVNEEMIIQATKLEKWSSIEVGNSKLLLVPLCDDEFSWETYL